MKKSEALTEILVALISAGAMWYVTAPRPNPVPWFWHHLGWGAYRVQKYANRQYMRYVEGYLNG